MIVLCCAHLALEKETAVNFARDQLLREMIEPASDDLPRTPPTRSSSSSSADTTSYYEPGSNFYVQPPDTDDLHRETTETTVASGITSANSQTDSGLSLNVDPVYAEAVFRRCGLSSSTTETPSSPSDYYELAKPDYYNFSGANNATMNSDEHDSNSEIRLNVKPSGADAAPYSELRSSTLEPSSSPAVYRELVKPDYYNITAGADNAASSDKPITDCEIALNVRPPEEVEGMSYSSLSSSTREFPPQPQVYDELSKRDYYNITESTTASTSV